MNCRARNPTVKNQIVSPLPSERLNAADCFTHIGMDLSGVLHTTDRIRVESEVIIQHNKKYYLLLVDFFSSLVHTELLNDRSTDEILNGLRRAFARRGRPCYIFADGEKGFKRIDMELQQIYTHVDVKQIKKASMMKE